jgi:hypothetical protein
MGHCTKAGALCVEISEALDAGRRHTDGPVITLIPPSDEDRGLPVAIAYHVPGLGRGKARIVQRNMVFRYCPWCGGTLR